MKVMIIGSHKGGARLAAPLLENASLFFFFFFVCHRERHPHLLVSIFKLFIDYKWSLTALRLHCSVTSVS